MLRGAAAGAGAEMIACIYENKAPPSPLTVEFQLNLPEDRCMNNRGHDAKIVIDRQGLICTSVGYVEAKMSSSGGDLCATDESHWGIYWQKADKTWKGQFNSIWRRGPDYDWFMLLFDESGNGNVFVCDKEEVCNKKSVSWSGTGKFYIVFTPDGLALDADLDEELRLIQQDPKLDL